MSYILIHHTDLRTNGLGLPHFHHCCEEIRKRNFPLRTEKTTPAVNALIQSQTKGFVKHWRQIF